jgi:2-polyprenyl-6-methoxyphenol hydroxylase-like FAD-dependent oxidoreductase
MSRIVVLGGGLCGLAAALLLTRDGHDVTVLERDAAPVPTSPEDAWEAWARAGVAQFRQTHYLTPRGCEVLDEALPDVRARLEEVGGLRIDLLGLMPPTVADRAPRPGDERFVTVNARRPTIEQALAAVAEATPALEVRRGTEARELVVGAYDGVPHVAGVRTTSGEELLGDLVVDAMGRRSQLPKLLEAAGAGPIHEESEDSGFLYYTRYFRLRDGGEMPAIRGPLVTPIGTFSVLTIPADNGTWSVTIYASTGDRVLKRLRDAACWSALLGACPLHAHWMDGEPVTGVMPMGGVVDRYRRVVVDGRPAVTGVAMLGDAWACTNPSQGRGMTLGLIHAGLLRDTVREHPEDPHAFAEAWDAVTEQELTPWYRETVEEDRARLRQIEALRSGVEPAPPPPDSPSRLLGAIFAAAGQDADAFRAFLATRSCLARQDELLADDAFVAKVLDLARSADRPPLPGPDRAGVERLMAEVVTAPG